MIDSHCHLADEVFAPDLDGVVDRARDAGLERALVILEARQREGSRAGGARRRALAGCASRSACTRIRRTSSPTTRSAPRRSCARSSPATPAARAIGEIGLDYHYDFSPRDVQQAVFRAQVRLARELRSAGRHPHARGRRGHAARFCAKRAAGRARACCTASRGTPALARRRASPWVLHLARRHRDVSEGRRSCARRSRRVPLDRLLTETDSPFLAPVPHRGKRNEPALRRAGRRRAWRSCTACRADDLAARTAANFHTLFRP